MVDASLKFRKQFLVNDLQESSFERWMHDLGGVYYRNKDKEDHDILMFKVCKNKKDADKIFKTKQFIAWWIDKSFSISPDKQILVLFDMTSVGLANVDIDLIKYQVSCFTTYFPGMLASMIIYEMPWVLNAIWKLIKNLLTPEQQKKVLFLKKSDIQKYIDADNLPCHMGGNDNFEYKYLPSLDSGIDMSPTTRCVNGESGDAPILNGDVTNDNHFDSLASCSTCETVAGDHVSSTSSPSPQPSTSNSSSGNVIRKRVTFSNNDDVQMVSNEEQKGVSSSPCLSVSPGQSDASKTNGNNPIATLKPAEQLMFYVTDKTRETQDIITVSNNSAHWMAFKIKTTNPECFRVRPSTGLIRPNESAEIFVYLQPGAQKSVAHEKFLVMLMQVEEGVKMSSLAERWKNPPTDPEKYLEHRFYCAMRSGDELFEPDSMTRAEEVMAGIKQKVSEIVHSQKRLEEKLYNIYLLQAVLGMALLLMGLYLFIAFIFDFFPFTGNGCTAFNCSYNHWRDFT